LGISRQATGQWLVAPAKQQWAISRLSGVSRGVLRPDLHRTPRKKSGADLSCCRTALQALREAVEEMPPEALGLTRESRAQYLSEIALPVA
jgi:hypothetical protein